MARYLVEDNYIQHLLRALRTHHVNAKDVGSFGDFRKLVLPDLNLIPHNYLSAYTLY